MYKLIRIWKTLIILCLIWLAGFIFSSPALAIGIIQISSSDFTSAQTEYNMYTDADGTNFTVTYIPPSTGTDETVLVVKCPEYGARFAVTPVLHGAIIDAQYLNSEHTEIAVVISDGETNDVTIEFTLETAMLSQADAITWMDTGSLTTSISATEYKGTVSGGVLTEDTSFTGADFTFCTMSPESTGSTSVSNTHSYNYTVSSQPLVTNYMLLNAGLYISNNGIYCGPNQNGSIRYEIPTVNNGNPLIEITGMKIYVPDERLELTGLDITQTYNGLRRRGRVLDGSDFDEMWNGWVIGTRQTETSGPNIGRSYYIITPDSRWFNNGNDDTYTNAFYGMRFVWQLSDTSLPLNYSTTAGTLTDFDAPDTELIYQELSSSTGSPSAGTFTHTGPRVQTRSRVDGEITNAYQKNRRDDLAYLSPVVKGADYSDDVFSYTNNNHWLNSETTESVPSYSNTVTQKYDFPYEIQPTLLYIKQYRHSQLHYREIDMELASVVYYTSDAPTVAKYATTTEITAANEYFSYTSSTEPTIALDIPSTERVLSVQLNWNGLSALQTGGYYAITGPCTNDATTGELSGTYLEAVAFDYIVPSDASSGHTQVPYTMTAGVNYYDSNYIYFNVTDPLPPRLVGSIGTVPEVSRSSGQYSVFAENTTRSSYNTGSLHFSIGDLNSRVSPVVNPVIDLGMKFDRQYSNGAYYNTNTMVGMTEAEGIAFLTGTMTATEYLSGWVFTYTTNMQTTATTYTVPTLTADTQIQIPLASDEYFTSLSMSYPGDFYLYDDYANTGSNLYLIKSIDMQTLTHNPFTGAALSSSSSVFGYCPIVLQAEWQSDNCYTTGAQEMDVSYRGNRYEEEGPQCLIYWNRQAALPKPTTSLDTTVDIVPQGDSSQFSADFTLTGLASTSDLRPFNQRFYDIYGLTSSTWNYLCLGIPWAHQEAVYIELTDNEFVVDLSNTYLLGVCADTADVEHAIVTVGSSKYLKLWFADSYFRTSNNGWRGAFENAYVFYGNNYNLAGNVSVGFKTMPGCTTGMHYPIGKIYLDFSHSLDEFDAPNDTFAENPTRTDLVFNNAVTDSLGLSSSLTTEDKLWEYDASSTSTTPYTVEVTLQSVQGANLTPGTNEVYEWTTYETQFYGEHKNNLDCIFSVTSPTNNAMYNYEGYIYIPRAGSSVDYMDSTATLQTATSEYNMYLNGIEELGNAASMNPVYSYTTDPAPDETSVYTTTTPTTTAQWNAVTAVKVEISEIPQATGFNINLNMSADKQVLGSQFAYIGGIVYYDLSTTQTTPYSAYISLGSYEYLDYDFINSSRIWYDTFDENGTQGQTVAEGSAYETAVENITINLYDTDGTTLINSSTSNSSGKFTMSSYKHDAGQILEFVLPTYVVPGNNASGSADWILTQLSVAGMEINLTDSDFDRTTNRLILPELTTAGLDNISAGIARLPELDAGVFTQGTPPSGYTGHMFSNVGGTGAPIYQRDTSGDYYVGVLEMYIGETKSITAALRDYYDDDLPAGSAYNITYVHVNDTSIATAAPLAGDDIELTGTSTTAYNHDISITGVSPGDTYIEFQTTNVLGDVFTTRAYIRVSGYSLGDRVWVDADMDGTQDIGEEYLNGVTAALYDSTGTQIGTSVTTGSGTWADGYYEFSSLSGGDYYVVFDLPSEYHFASQNTGTDDTDDSDVDPSTGQSDTVTLNDTNTDSSRRYLLLDAGAYQYGTVTLTKTDQNDVPIIGSSAVFQLYRSDDTAVTMTAAGSIYTYSGLGTATDMSTDIASGQIIINELPYGDYYFREISAPAEYIILTASTAFTVDESAESIGIQNDRLYSLGDYVWIDEDADGIQDALEERINGVTVTLYDSTDVQVGTPVITGSGTWAVGYYEFDSLSGGEYYVVFSNLPSGYQFTLQNVGMDDTYDSDVDQSTGRTDTITLDDTNTDSTRHYLHMDAGVYQYGAVTLTKTDGTNAITTDTAEFTLYDSSDNAIILTGTAGSYSFTSTGSSTDIPTTMITNGSGEIILSGLPYGDYYFIETDAPDGYRLDSTTHHYITVDGTSQTIEVTNTKIYSLGNCVWIDENLNGIQDPGERYLNDVTVTLYDSTDTQVGVPVITGSGTWADGYYEFDSLPEGDYYVVFSNLPIEYRFTSQNTGTDDTDDSDVDPSTGRTDTITLNDANTDSNNHYSDLDAGVYGMTNSYRETAEPENPKTDDDSCGTDWMRRIRIALISLFILFCVMQTNIINICKDN